jgi:hypothetical protein
MYGFTNEAGEPIMDGAAYRYEQYLDSMYEPDPYDSWEGSDWGVEEPEPFDPAECSHGDGSYPEGAGFECDGCDETYLGPRTAPVEWNGWESDNFFSKR